MTRDNGNDNGNNNGNDNGNNNGTEADLKMENAINAIEGHNNLFENLNDEAYEDMETYCKFIKKYPDLIIKQHSKKTYEDEINGLIRIYFQWNISLQMLMSSVKFNIYRHEMTKNHSFAFIIYFKIQELQNILIDSIFKLVVFTPSMWPVIHNGIINIYSPLLKMFLNSDHFINSVYPLFIKRLLLEKMILEIQQNKSFPESFQIQEILNFFDLLNEPIDQERKDIFIKLCNQFGLN